MNMVKNISSWILFAALLMLSACTKNHTPAEAPTPVGFRAMSQSVMVKGDPEVLAFPYDDFGVWGIATEPLNDPYMLWNDNALAQVSRVDGSETFAPQTDAYWFTGYKYYFLALAPFSSGVTNLNISKTLSGNQLTSNPSMSFAYDLAAKYDSEEYDYDLLAAAQYKDISAPSEKPAAQDLVFWHLFSRICIKVNFVNATGTVTSMRLHGLHTDVGYTISLDDDKNLSVIPTEPTSDVITIPFNRDNLDPGTTSQWSIHIVPQDISEFRLFIDYEITDQENTVSIINSEINLAAAKIDPFYAQNSSFNWNVSISPKNISFDVSFSEWSDGGSGEFELQ